MSKNTKSPKLTPLFPADVKPVRVGVYPTEYDWLEGYSHWDGHKWSYQCLTVSAAASRHGSHGSQNKLWRGLASDPKVAS